MCTTYREKLLKDGVPLRVRQAGRASVPGRVRPHLLYANSQWVKEGQGGTRSHREFMAQKSREFKDLPECSRRTWEVEAACHRSGCVREARGSDDADDAGATRRFDSGVLWDLATEDMPLDPDQALTHLLEERQLGGKYAGRFGFAAWGPKLAEELLTDMLVRDQG